MSGALNGSLARALVPPEKAQELLEEVLYERVVEHVDVAALYKLESDLWMAMCDVEVMHEDAARTAARDMIARALRRLADEPDRYAQLLSPFGDDCELCEEEARANAKPRVRPSNGH